MDNNFLTYAILITFAGMHYSTFMIVEFIKELEPFKQYKTKYLAWGVSFALFIIVFLMTYKWVGDTWYTILWLFILKFVWNIPLWILWAIQITMASNGTSDFNNPVDKTRKE